MLRPMTRDDVDAAHLHDLAGIAAYFTVPSMGVEPDTAALHIDDVAQVFEWLGDYRSQPFPGVVDRAQAQQGRALYAAACASCHGSYDASLTRPRLLSFPNREADIGTDRARAGQFEPEVVDAMNRSSYAKYLDVAASRHYTAPPLAGIWASAPYFHNGSVPTLWQLMTPKERATRFVVGGHALDLRDLGIALTCDAQRRCTYPAGYQAFSEPAVIDTTKPGLGSGGHEQDFESLDDTQKRALLEYLKLL
jgi:hypothetical protein